MAFKPHFCAKIIPQISVVVWAECVTVCNNAGRREGSPQCKHFTMKSERLSIGVCPNAQRWLLDYTLGTGSRKALMAYILILIVYYGNASAVTSVQFDSKTACENAIIQMQKAKGFSTSVLATCNAKG